MVDRIEVYVSDPWDFVTDNGAGPFLASLLRTERGERPPSDPWWLLRLDQPLRNEHGAFSYLLAASRLVGHNLDQIAKGEVVPANLAFVSDDQAAKEQSFNTTIAPPFGFVIGSIQAARQ